MGEEGEGNLSGMRFICKQSALLANVRAFLVLDGPSTDHITAQALASRRFEVSFAGPGGHSWNDYGTPNPVHAIGEVISAFAQSADARLGSEKRTRCSYNFGLVEGGTSVNSIPSSARAKLDFRSEDPQLLRRDLSALNSRGRTKLRTRKSRRAFRAPHRQNQRTRLASRRSPSRTILLFCARCKPSTPYLQIRARVDCASTDANVPLSMGLPAVSIGAGGQGGGAHSNQEWYQPETRELGLRRILLALAALAEENRSAEAAG